MSPKGWKVVYERLYSFRSENMAPVDTMGCSSLANVKDPEKVQRFHILLGLLLSSQTRDEITAQAVHRLQDKWPPFSPSEAVTIPRELLADTIKPVSFHQRKAGYIIQVSQILLEKYQGDIPDTLEELVELPGIGPKMANLCMQVAWKSTVGIGVDTHVHRISNRLGWVNNTKSPIDTQKGLESWLPKEYWADINKLLVGFGQIMCTAKAPKCSRCPLYQYCPYGQAHK